MERSDFSKGITGFFLLIIVSLGLLLFDNAGLLVKPRSAATAVILPAQGFFLRTGQGVANFFSFFTFWRSGRAKIDNLEMRVRELTVEAEKVKNLEAENKALKEQLGIPISKERKLIMAGVVGFPKELILDKGLKDGVEEGMAVIYKDVFVGKVSKSLFNSSLVFTASDPMSKVTAVTSKTGAKGIVAGQFGSGASLEKVVSEDSLVMDDIVLTSGEDGVLKGLLIGKVSEIKREDAGVFQNAQLSLMLDYSKLTTVFVLAKE